jgi:DNA gyrase subunit A
MEVTEYKGKPALHITSVPDLVFFDKVKVDLEKLIEANVFPQIISIDNASTLDKKGNEIFSVYIVLKKGSDPNYVREKIYHSTAMQKTIAVNFEVIKDEQPVLMGYKDYLLNFLTFRRQTKIRMYANRLQEVKTEIHKLLLYIRAMESGEIDTIISMIRKQKGTDDKVYIDYLVNKLNVTPIQAKFILGIDVRKLSLGYLEKYKEDVKKYEEMTAIYLNKVTIPEEIDKEIEEELHYFKKKYSCPRRSKIIPISEVSGVPAGTFKVVITKGNYIKKIGENDHIGSMGGDEAKCVFIADNRDNVLIFGAMGKVFKLPVHKIPFTDTLPYISIYFN